MEKIDVSFIIPAYNCGRFIDKVIRSIFRQNIKSFEIIIVNDCSTDNTLEIINSIKQKHTNIKVLSHEINKAQGAARNTGIDVAVGEFVYFIDADDWLSDGGVGELLEIASLRHLDVVACGVQTISLEGHVNLYHAYDFESSGGREGVDFFSQYKIGAIACNKLFRRSFLNDFGIRFAEEYFHEDIPFNASIALECERYFSISKIFVNYFQNQNSTCNMIPTRRHLESYLNLYFWMSDYLDELRRRGISDPALIRRLSRNYGYAEVFPKLKRYASTRSRSVFVEEVHLAMERRMGSAGICMADFICGIFESYASEA